MKKFLIFIVLSILFISCSKESQKEEWVTNETEKVVNNSWTNDTTINSDKKQETTNETLAIEEKLDYGVYYELLNSEKYNELETELNKIKKDDKEIYKIYAKSYLAQKKYNEALEKAQKADSMFEWKNPDMNVILWVIYDNLWDKEKAKTYVKKALEIDPKFKDAKEYLEIIEESQKTESY